MWRAWISLRWLLAWVFTLVMSGLACLSLLVGQPQWGWKLCLKPWAKGTLWLIGLKLDIVGEHYASGPAVFICNHQSMLDIIFVPALLPTNIRFVAKKELGRVPLWGWILKNSAGIMVDRKNPRAAVASITQAIARLPRGFSVVVFPEGTRSADGCLQPFKKGAFHIARATGLPVVPIAIEGAHALVPKGAILTRPGKVFVTFGAPLDTSTWTADTMSQHVAQGFLAVSQCLAKSRARCEGAGRHYPGGQRVLPAEGDRVEVEGGHGHSDVDAHSTSVQTLG